MPKGGGYHAGIDYTHRTAVVYTDYIRKLECGVPCHHDLSLAVRDVEYDIACDDFNVPTLSVQPLVENAVRHGIATYDKGGTVRIRSYRKDGNIVIEVVNEGAGKQNITIQQEKRKGIGVENVRARLRSISDGELELITHEHGTTARITISEAQAAH